MQGFSTRKPEDLKKIADSVFRAPTEAEKKGKEETPKKEEPPKTEEKTEG
jgi:hypothetical protein